MKPAARAFLGISEAFEVAVKTIPDQDALVCGDDRVTYGELADRAEAIEQALLELRVRPGGRVAALAGNSIGYGAALWGVARVGTLVPVHARYTQEETRAVLDDSAAAAIVWDATCTDLALDEDSLAEVADGLPVLAIDGHGRVLDRRAGKVRSTDKQYPGLAMVQFTSGTTSRSKGVMLTGPQLVRNAYELGCRLDVRPGDRYASAMPFYHIGGSVLTLLLCAVHQATAVTQPRFDAAELLTLIGGERCTHLFGVEAMFTSILQRTASLDSDLASVRVCFAGGRPAVLDALNDVLTGRIVNRYGLTEGGGNVTTTALDDSFDVVRTSMGRPLPGVELRIVDLETNKTAKKGCPGEIQVRGWSVARGYLGRPAETRRAFTDDGWLATGDLGLVDEHGMLVYLRRMGDVLRVGSENVAPTEVESILLRHPDVIEAAVVGQSHALLGEVPVAFVEMRSEISQEDEHRLVGHCQAHLAAFKVPRRIYFVHAADWPRSSNGKVKKAVLQGQIELRADGGAQ